ncbi:hypothetical protein ACLB2K_030520 [Fragaria x ananassa]
MVEHIPEDVLVKIFQRLPVKSLISFTSVSKRWRFIILRDPHFAAAHYQIASHNKTLSHSVCFRFYRDSYYPFRSKLKSSSSPVEETFAARSRNLTAWFTCAVLVVKLPDLGGPNEFLNFTGFGYVSATNDYKILIANSSLKEGEQAKIHIFSSQSKSWRRIQDFPYSNLSMTMAGILCHEALHWLRFDVIVAFDLANEEFRTILLPAIREEYGGAYFRNEYDKGNSWTKLFNLRIADPDEQIRYIQPILVTETCTFLETQTASGSRPKLVRSYHMEEKIKEVHVRAGVIGYEESLLWLE